MRRDNDQAGFSLIELMIVVGVIATLASITIPNLLAARLRANETSAIATLRTVSSCQAQFATTGRADTDVDGGGEFATFRELAGAVAVRTAPDGTNVGGSPLHPPRLSSLFVTLTANSEAQRSGYFFKIFLPGPNGQAVEEAPTGTATSLLAPVDSDLCETTWCCYATPSSYSNSGNRTFFVNQGGDVLQVETSSYSGSGVFDSTNAGRAFRRGTGALTNITGVPAIGTVARDNRRWHAID